MAKEPKAFYVEPKNYFPKDAWERMRKNAEARDKAQTKKATTKKKSK